MKTILIILLAVCVKPVLAAPSTNQVFINDNDFPFRRMPQGKPFVDPKKIEEAKKSKESLPAESFPEGNWGKIQGGFQLSLRFEKQNVSVGEPAKAIILLRNTTDSKLEYQGAYPSSHDGPVELIVYSDGTNALPDIKDQVDIFLNTQRQSLVPGTQHKFVETVQRWVVLNKPGDYSVVAKLPIGKTPDGKPVEVQSGIAHFHLNAISPSGQ